jgi:hypothetical protein
MRTDRDIAYARFLNAWGTESQILKAIEEFNEAGAVLTRQVLTIKFGDQWDHAPTFEQIIDEVADAYLMVDQLAYIFGRDQVEQVIERKLAVVLHSVEEHEAKKRRRSKK